MLPTFESFSHFIAATDGKQAGHSAGMDLQAW